MLTLMGEPQLLFSLMTFPPAFLLSSDHAKRNCQTAEAPPAPDWAPAHLPIISAATASLSLLVELFAE